MFESQAPEGSDMLEGSGSLQALTKTTQRLIKDFSLASAGMYFYEAGRCFKINWSCGKDGRGSVAAKARDKNDEETYKKVHRSFHEKVAQFAK